MESEASYIITVPILLSAYCQGYFPMALDDNEIYWFNPDPRAILPIEKFHIPRSLTRLIKGGKYRISVNQAFREVILAWAQKYPGREETWINEEMIELYTNMHNLGYAHSVETWEGERLVGGLYGVSVAGLFAGESMFHLESDASKVALVYLVERLKHGDFVLLDVQFMNEHLRKFGAIEVTRQEYQQRLERALETTAEFSVL